jgi:hypothetical protein
MEEPMWRKVFLTVFLTALALASPAAAAYDSDPFLGRGILRAIRWMDRNIVIENADGFEILGVDHDATIRDAYGTSVELRDLPLGCEVEYVGQYWEGLNFARSLRVSPTGAIRARTAH